MVRLALAPAIILKESVLLGKCLGLEGPTGGGVHDQPIVEHQHWGILRTMKFVIKVHVVDFEERQFDPPLVW